MYEKKGNSHNKANNISEGRKIMNKKINDFLEEFSDNFSELYVETFLIRYLNNFNENELLNNIKELNNLTNTKIKKLFLSKLDEMGYSKKDILKILN